jgi:hypothetical protein
LPVAVAAASDDDDDDDDDEEEEDDDDDATEEENVVSAPVPVVTKPTLPSTVQQAKSSDITVTPTIVAKPSTAVVVATKPAVKPSAPVVVVAAKKKSVAFADDSESVVTRALAKHAKAVEARLAEVQRAATTTSVIDVTTSRQEGATLRGAIEQAASECTTAIEQSDEQRRAMRRVRAGLLAARAVVDEANTLLDARGDAAYAGLLRQRRLDPESAALRARLRPSLAALESGVADLQRHVALLHNAQRSPAAKRRAPMPSYERIYRTLEAQYRAIVHLTDVSFVLLC